MFFKTNQIIFSAKYLSIRIGLGKIINFSYMYIADNQAIAMHSS
jgi:hypothetical protein